MSQIPERAVKMAILQVIADQGRAHKLNLSRGHRGLIDARLASPLSDDEAWRVGTAFDDLRRAGLIRPDLHPSASPSDDWVVLSEAGREAIRRGHLDELDRTLAAIASHLVEIRSGAWQVLSLGTSEAARQAAHSARELVDQVLQLAAPDADVRNVAGFVPDSTSRNGINRRHRIRYIVASRSGRGSESDVRVAEALGNLVEVTHSKLKGLAHLRGSVDVSDARESLSAAEAALRRVLGIRDPV